MYRTILFDIDGVMLSEERYFDASALTVYELLHSPHYFGIPVDPLALPPFRTDFSPSEIARIRRVVFANDEVLHFLKRIGINANWDIVYVQTAYQFARVLEALGTGGFHESVSQCLKSIVEVGWTRDILHRIGKAARTRDLFAADYGAFLNQFGGYPSKTVLFQSLQEMVHGVLVEVAGNESRPGLHVGQTLWNLCRETFQEWYLGEEYAVDAHQQRKPGFLTQEEALVPEGELRALLRACRKDGVSIGIATGRPTLETLVPLESLGIVKFFRGQHITTADHVLHAEQVLPSAAPLSKPHPFSYLRSYRGIDDARTVLQTALPLSPAEGDDVLIVGDSVADLLAAKAMGCRFAAVLTGLEGASARTQFTGLGADHIWENVLGVREVLGQSDDRRRDSKRGT